MIVIYSKKSEISDIFLVVEPEPHHGAEASAQMLLVILGSSRGLVFNSFSIKAQVYRRCDFSEFATSVRLCFDTKGIDYKLFRVRTPLFSTIKKKGAYLFFKLKFLKTKTV